LDIVKSAREMSKDNIKLKDKLIKEANDDWKKNQANITLVKILLNGVNLPLV